MSYVILSCSLDNKSRSRNLALEAKSYLEEAKASVELFDMQDERLPPFDNASVFADPLFLRLHAAISGADGVVIATPVYNWSLGSVAKGVIEATGATGENGHRSAWFDKIVTFLCAGGLPHSYMAYSHVAMSLMLDFKCIINPYVVYATDRDWTADERPTGPLAARLSKTVDVKIQLVEGLRDRTYRSGWEV